VIDDPGPLPLRVLLERPDHVGIDRLFDAVAANSRRPAGTPAVVVDAGSAVTVDWLDETGAFRGGAILPGLRLMAQALHDYTALLPLIEPPRDIPPLPGTATPPAVAAGIFWAVVGGIEVLIRRYAEGAGVRPDAFLTGGDAPVLHRALPRLHLWPAMTLEGIRLTAEALP
jgi:type III pantothenate kinase